LINYLTRLGWAHGDMEIFTMEEATNVFSLEGISTSPGKWDLDKLTWVNSQWMKKLEPEVLVERLKPFLERRGLAIAGHDLMIPVMALRERSRTLVEMAEAAAFFYLPDDQVPTDPEAVAGFLTPDNKAMLAKLAEALEPVEVWSEAGIEKTTQDFCKASGLKLGKVAQPARVALCGQKVGPGLFQILAGLGKVKALRRLRAAGKQLDTSTPAG
jgi:glutamyl-tRNA synthetase